MLYSARDKKLTQKADSAAISDRKIKKLVLDFQVNEITEYHIYQKLAALSKNKHNQDLLRQISEEELRHHDIWKEYTGCKVRVNRFKYFLYVFIVKVFGLTFGIKLMEGGEKQAQDSYQELLDRIPQAQQILEEENSHEKQLISIIDEEKLKYMGSVVLGLNDALVEFTGALAGFTLALRDSNLIGLTGFIMGFSASLSMAASEYLAVKTETGQKNPLKASIYTGTAYAVTVMLLVLPYFLFDNCYFALGLTVVLAISLILFFTFYYSVIRESSFKRRFLEMVTISMGVAILSFFVGLGVRQLLGAEV